MEWIVSQTDTWGTELSESTREEMRLMGDYGPTVNPKNREVKGVYYDTEEACSFSGYLTSADLRARAAACIEVADWLDRRAATAGGGR